MHTYLLRCFAAAAAEVWEVHFYSESIIDSFVELVKCGRTTNFPEDIFIWRYFCFPPYLSKQGDSVDRVESS